MASCAWCGASLFRGLFGGSFGHLGLVKEVMQHAFEVPVEICFVKHLDFKYCNFTFASGLQICLDASASARILALAGEGQDNLAIQEVPQMAPFGLWQKALEKLPRLPGEAFDMVRDFPESEPALLDLRRPFH